MLNKEEFFNSIRPHVNLTTQNVSGLDRMLNLATDTYLTPRNWLAYILATVWWETAQTMQPVREAYWMSENWRKRNLRYYPWYGRGLIQTTWEENYRKLGELVGYDFTKNPDALLDWKWAGPAVFVAMEEGLYTGKDLDDYIDLEDDPYEEDLKEYINARRIVNGTDRARKIAMLAIDFEQALIDSNYPLIPTKKIEDTVPEDIAKKIPEVKKEKESKQKEIKEVSISGFLIQLLKRIFQRKS